MTREDCRSFEPLLARAADDTIESADGARLDRHLAECESCRRLLADQRMAREALRARPRRRASPELALRVMAAIETERSWLDWVDYRRWTWRLAPVAAALLVATWAIAEGSLTDTTSSTASPNTAEESLPVSAALWQESMTDTSVLSLMLRARADDPLADAVKER